MRILAFFFASMCIVGLSGCLGDQRGRIEQSDDEHILRMAKDVATSVVAAHPQPVINVPPAEKVDVEELKNSINISSEKTANQMSGLLNTNISKLTDQIKGVEANIGKLAEINNQMTANLTNRIDSEIRASAEFKAELKASIQSNIELRAQLQAQLTAMVTVQNEMKADLKAIANITAKLDAQGTAIAGVGNAVSQMQQDISNKAGRDVNYFPKEVMYVLLGFVVLLALFAFLYSRNNTHSMDLKFKEVNSEKKQMYGLLLRVVSLLSKVKTSVVVASEQPDGQGTRDINQDSIDKVLTDAQTILKGEKSEN